MINVHSSGVATLKMVRLALPPNPSPKKISGTTFDSRGTVLAGCAVDLFRTVNDVFVSATVSDASGQYSFDVAPTDGPFYLVAYKSGTTDKAGTSPNTLMGT